MATESLPKVHTDGPYRECDHVDIEVGLVGFFGADIQEALLDQLAYLRGDDPAGDLGITKNENGSPRG